MATIETYFKPTLLYRYRSLGATTRGNSYRIDPNLLEREIRAIESNYIYCSTYNAMNDPMEGLYRTTRRVKQSDDYEEVVRELKNEKLGLGVASFCEAWDNELMWAHYAGGFCGICVAYSLSKLLDGLDNNHTFTRVAYGDRPYSLNLAGRRDRADRARAVLSTKSLKWAYEREWRLFAPTPGEAAHGAGAASHVYLGARFTTADRNRLTHGLERAGIEVRPTRINGYAVEVEQDD